MLKWLTKILGADAEGDKNKTDEDTASKPSESAPARSRRSHREAEKPLPAPRIDLEDAIVDDGTGFVARQAIINREYRLVGYEFSMRDRTRARISLDVQSQKINDQLLLRAINSLGVEKLAKFRQLWVSVVDAFIVSPMIESLPAAATVLVIRVAGHGGRADEAILARATALRKAGYKLALGSWSEAASHSAWLPLIDYVVIDTTAYNPAEVGEIARTIADRAPSVQVLARHVDSFEEFEFCFRARYQLFLGSFLTKRENWPPQPKMNPDRVRLCELLNSLRAGDEISEVAERLRQSPELSYRLLRYINSAAMGLQTRVASIERSLVFLGREKLYRWLTLLLFNADDSRSTDGALLEQALVRGRMMEALASERMSRMQCDEIFVVGIFSLLDMLLKLPMSVALDPLQLPPQVAGALVADDGDYAPYLRLAIACEAQDTEKTAELARLLDFSVDKVNVAHFEALAWTQDTLAPAPPETEPE